MSRGHALHGVWEWTAGRCESVLNRDSLVQLFQLFQGRIESHRSGMLGDCWGIAGISCVQRGRASSARCCMVRMVSLHQQMSDFSDRVRQARAQGFQPRALSSPPTPPVSTMSSAPAIFRRVPDPGLAVAVYVLQQMPRASAEEGFDEYLQRLASICVVHGPLSSKEFLQIFVHDYALHSWAETAFALSHTRRPRSRPRPPRVAPDKAASNGSRRQPSTRPLALADLSKVDPLLFAAKPFQPLSRSDV